jgi:hypothetical protein
MRAIIEQIVSETLAATEQTHWLATTALAVKKI